jgi:hypothetical protein
VRECGINHDADNPYPEEGVMSPTAIGWITVFLGSLSICAGISSFFFLDSVVTLVLGVVLGIILIVVSGLSFHRAKKAHGQ